MKTFYAGGFFYNPETKEVLLHKRDGKTSINPHKWTFFGGSSEEGETPIETFIREIKEELNVSLRSDEVIPLCDYPNKERAIHRYIFYIVTDMPKSEMTLGEGADFDWISLENVFTYDLSDKTVTDLNFFLKTLA